MGSFASSGTHQLLVVHVAERLAPLVERATLRERDHVVGGLAKLLALRKRSLDLTVTDQLSRQATQQRLALIGRAVKLPEALTMALQHKGGRASETDTGAGAQKELAKWRAGPDTNNKLWACGSGTAAHDHGDAARRCRDSSPSRQRNGRSHESASNAERGEQQDDWTHGGRAEPQENSFL